MDIEVFWGGNDRVIKVRSDVLKIWRKTVRSVLEFSKWER